MPAPHQYHFACLKRHFVCLVASAVASADKHLFRTGVLGWRTEDNIVKKLFFDGTIQAARQ
jgi:hypothetical protein